MAEECCTNTGCGCGNTYLYSDRVCPECGRKLRVTGNIQQIKLYLTCPECGYQSPQLSTEELRVLID